MNKHGTIQFFKDTRPIEENEEIQIGDWIEWSNNAWTTIDEGSVYVGKTPNQAQPGINFRRTECT